MNTLLPDKSQTNNKVNPSQAVGAMGWIDETGFERGERLIDVTSVVKGVGSLVFEDILGMSEEEESGKLSIGGQTELNFKEKQAKAEEKVKEQEKKRKETDRKKTFYQNLKDDQLRAQMAKDRMFLEEEINDKISSFSTEQTNEMLHLQADYKDNKSVYHKAELRKKLIEQRRKNDKQKKEASIPSPAKQIYALEGAFEGASGKVGSGTANFGKGSVQ